MKVRAARVYGQPAPGEMWVLVDRLWPRGMAKGDAPFQKWAKNVAPSPELRKWYGHDPGRFAEFARRYRAELAVPPASEALQELKSLATKEKVVLVTATKDLERSGAEVLRQALGEP